MDFYQLEQEETTMAKKWILNNTGPSSNGVRMCALDNSNIQNNDTLDYIENKNLHDNYQQQMEVFLILSNPIYNISIRKLGVGKILMAQDQYHLYLVQIIH